MALGITATWSRYNGKEGRAIQPGRITERAPLHR